MELNLWESGKGSRARTTQPLQYPSPHQGSQPLRRICRAGSRDGQGGDDRAHRAQESARLFNEEVIQLARISLSAAFIKCKSSRDVRGTVGTAGEASGARHVVKQSRRGENEKNEEKKQNGASEKEIKHKAAQMRRRQGVHSAQAPLLCSPQTSSGTHTIPPHLKGFMPFRP